ncbi:hypothetical protein SANTM175S_02608 [Streptomyces antimycoticus]
MATAVSEETLRIPGGVEHDEPLTAPHAQSPPEPLTVGAAGQQAVEARVAREDGRLFGFGAYAPQPLQLLRVGQHEAVHEGFAVREQPLR